MNLSVEEKQKKVNYMRNYYLAHKKSFLWFYNVVVNLEFLGQNSEIILIYKKYFFRVLSSRKWRIP